METAVEWLMRMLEGQKNEPFNYDEWQIAFEHALDMEKQQNEIMLDGMQYYIENKTKTDEKDNTDNGNITNNNNNSRLHL
jgi:hypothetical protein